MLWGRSVNIDGITIALISYKVYISWTTRHFMHRIFCFYFDIGITCKQLYKLRSFHSVRCAFLGLLWLVNKHTLKPWMIGAWQSGGKGPACLLACFVRTVHCGRSGLPRARQSHKHSACRQSCTYLGLNLLHYLCLLSGTAKFVKGNL